MLITSTSGCSKPAETVKTKTIVYTKEAGDYVASGGTIKVTCADFENNIGALAELFVGETAEGGENFGYSGLSDGEVVTGTCADGTWTFENSANVPVVLDDLNGDGVVILPIPFMIDCSFST